jgi:two-component system OmpR family response regulator
MLALERDGTVLMGSRRVLVIDDDRTIAELLSIALSDEGYETRVADGGRDGLVVLRQWKPDLILLDLLMWDMDGWAFQAEARRQGLDGVPVLVVTAASVPGLQMDGLAAPILPKPFELGELLAEVDRLTSGPALEVRGQQTQGTPSAGQWPALVATEV